LTVRTLHNDGRIQLQQQQQQNEIERKKENEKVRASVRVRVEVLGHGDVTHWGVIMALGRNC
jgi:hypothetical protein